MFSPKKCETLVVSPYPAFKKMTFLVQAKSANIVIFFEGS
jgi:hypothetical protein